MKIATSATVFRDAVGFRLSITYSVVDDETGRILADNKRATKVITDAEVIQHADVLLQVAQAYAETITD